ncbi:hypothetical protein KOM00_18570 [Geomonas sp. Red69]|uniref:Uncharacterized protein n=1 Tax=Geomonas diazotrophica TaxID=2843197 RepID=A0ABX8JJY0_9BACT|nr:MULTISPECIES: hypothetical protein [Geomonas]MBU5638733.1 hypothetical protein [Geomonas diazotrophica]QWV98690.1 hypothetical protein KP005_05225 [Geomonas nitrogeniifigens]QXE87847.1 hypothetical protein KP003_05430 [Geomonas nitrogeniifigens]
MGSKEAGSLIIKSMFVFEEVFREYLDSVGPAVYSEISALIEKPAQHEKWTGSFDLWEEDEVWFAPLEWAEDGTKEDFKAYYCLDYINDGKVLDEYLYHISPILGITATQAGFSFALERKYIGNPKVGDLKKFCQNHRNYDSLIGIGFRQTSNGKLFIPFKVDATALADAYANDTIVDALQPIADALEKLRNAHPLFAELVADAERSFLK